MPKQIRDLPVEYSIQARSLADSIGSRVRSRRTELSLTQEQLRARLELAYVAVSRTQYSRLENGDVLPDAAEIVALSKVLEVSLDWLLLGE